MAGHDSRAPVRVAFGRAPRVRTDKPTPDALATLRARAKRGGQMPGVPTRAEDSADARPNRAARPYGARGRSTPALPVRRSRRALPMRGIWGAKTVKNLCHLRHVSSGRGAEAPPPSLPGDHVGADRRLPSILYVDTRCFEVWAYPA